MSNTLARALKEPIVSVETLRVLADNSFDSVLITDTTKRSKILYANKAFKTLTGYSPSEVIGKTPKLLQGSATDKKVLARLLKALQEGDRFEGKAINYRKDGTPFIMHWRVVPVKVSKQTKVWLAIQREAYGV